MRCKTCNIIKPGQFINIPNRKPFKPNVSMNCTSSFIIYCLICDNCNLIYIGQTSVSLSNRITLHRQHTNHSHYSILNCNKHFHNCSNNKFSVIPIYSLQTFKNISKLLFMEHFFIKLLKPELNSI